MESRPIAAKLLRVGKEFCRIGEFIHQVRWQIHLDFPDTDHITQELDLLCDITSRITDVAKELAETEGIVAQEALALTAHADPYTEGRTFQCFLRLPPELRYMIWKRVAEPPPCMHFHDSYTVIPNSRLPAAYLMVDGGLWTACQESRRIIRRLYNRSCIYSINPCSIAPGQPPLELHYRSLGLFNKNGEGLKDLIEHLKRKFTGVLSAVMHELFKIGPDTIRSVFGGLVLYAEKYCRELRVEDLFEPHLGDIWPGQGWSPEGMQFLDVFY